ncbi:MAG: Asp23/Gls24 family envelope stress response protein [Verrucomicrobiota bacterium]
MPAKKAASKPATETEPHTIPTPTEVGDSTDEIHINIPVVANIVKMAALQVDGVYSVGGTFADGLWESLGAKKMERGVEVTEDEAENYVIQIHVEMRFGVEIASTAKIVQQTIRDQVQRMTSKSVSKIDVYIDGVRTEATEEKAKQQSGDWEQPHTD